MSKRKMGREMDDEEKATGHKARTGNKTNDATNSKNIHQFHTKI